MAADLILYNYFRSSASYRVRVALELKSVPYEYRPVHLLKDEQNRPEFREINAMGQLPCLVHKGKVLAQSVAMIEYIEALWPKPSLFPKDPYQAGLVRQCVEIVNSGIHPLQNLKAQKQIEVRFGANQDAKNDWAAFWIREGFDSLEKFLAPHAGKYSIGDEVTAGDLFVLPQIVNARRFKVDLTPYPTLRKVEEACLKLPAFQKSHPDQQPDTPKE
ncbi:MAG: maleylacetoacetate isomerase [Bdellovibrionia bacterium]